MQAFQRVTHGQAGLHLFQGGVRILDRKWIIQLNVKLVHFSEVNQCMCEHIK